MNATRSRPSAAAGTVAAARPPGASWAAPAPGWPEWPAGSRTRKATSGWTSFLRIQVPELAVDPVDEHEAGEDGHEEQDRHRHARHDEESRLRPARQAADVRPRRQRFDRALDGPGGRALPDLAVGHALPGGQGRQPAQPRAVAEGRVVLQHRVGIDHRVAAQAHRPQHQLAPLDPGVVHVDGRADAGARFDQSAGRALAGRSNRSARRGRSSPPRPAGTSTAAACRSADRPAAVRRGGRPATSGNRSRPRADSGRAFSRPATSHLPAMARGNSGQIRPARRPPRSRAPPARMLSSVAGKIVIDEERQQPVRRCATASATG